MSEEIQNASTNIPRSLMFTLAINGTLGFAALIAVLFCIGDIDKALASPTGFPFIEITAQAVGTKGATALISLTLSLFVFATVSVYAAASRMLWAFARDHGVPGSRYLGQVSLQPKLTMTSFSVLIPQNRLRNVLNCLCIPWL